MSTVYLRRDRQCLLPRRSSGHVSFSFFLGLLLLLRTDTCFDDVSMVWAFLSSADLLRRRLESPLWQALAKNDEEGETLTGANVRLLELGETMCLSLSVSPPSLSLVRLGPRLPQKQYYGIDTLQNRICMSQYPLSF